MLKNEVWERISNEDFNEKGEWVGQYMCLNCMEEALGRKVREHDLMLTESHGKPCHVFWNERFVKRYGRKRIFPLFMELNGDLIRTHLEHFNGGKK